MSYLGRSSSLSFLGRWWWNLDGILFFSIISLELIGFIIVFTSSPAIGLRLGISAEYFFTRYIVYFIISIFILIIVSMIDESKIKILALLGVITILFLMMLVLFYGVEIKGSRRWLYLGGISMQPSEFIKPFFSIVIAFLLNYCYSTKIKYLSVMILYSLIAVMLILQPDFGMLITISGILFVTLFIYGLSLRICTLFGLTFSIGMIGAYTFFPHVKNRINNFISSDNENNYQVIKALEAFDNGGILGLGPGEGVIKYSLPDAHTDFIFALIGEEFGLLGCSFILLLFTIIATRSLYLVMSKSNELSNFVKLAIIALITHISLQAFINMGVSLNILPTKGMTLPYISYGGSSNLSTAITSGFLLALTRKRESFFIYNNDNGNQSPQYNIFNLKFRANTMPNNRK